MTAATTTTISSTLAVVLLCAAASMVAAGAGAGGHHHHLEASDDDLVAKTCANVTRRHYKGPGLARQFCESALRSDKRGVAAARDARGLALVAMDLVRRGATDAVTTVDGALRAGATAKWSKSTMLYLHYCRQDHDAVARTAPECRALVQDYDPRAAAGHGRNMIAFAYLECADRLMHAAHDCWIRMFYEKGEPKEAVWKEVVEVAGRANLAKAMVEQMVDVVKGDDDDDHY